MKRLSLSGLLFLFAVFMVKAQDNRPEFYFLHLNDEKGLSHNHVKSILRDSYDFMWFGTSNGLNRFDGQRIKQFECYDRMSGEENNNISALYEDKRKRLWVGTGEGTYIFNPQTGLFTRITMRNKDGKDASGWINNIQSDRRGDIWAVMPGEGVFRFMDGDERQVKHYYTLRNVRGTCIDNDGALWVGSWREGLFRFIEKEDRFEKITKDKSGNSLTDLNMVALAFHNQAVYQADYSGKVMRYDTKEQQLTRLSVPISGTVQISALQVIDDTLWICTSDGIYIYNLSTGETIHISNNTNSVFSLSDSETTCIYPDKDQVIWMGTVHGGINYYPSGNLDSNNNSKAVELTLPPVCITDFFFYNEPAQEGTGHSPLSQPAMFTDHITLNHDQNQFSVNVVLPFYTLFGDVQYYYRLEPTDRKWMPTFNNTLSFGQLSPGNYKLYIKANYNNNYQESPVHSLNITILPAWYHTAWASYLFLLLLFVLLLFYFLYRYHRRKNRLKEKHRLQSIQEEKELSESKVRFFAEVAHEINTPLTLINGPLEAINEIPLADDKLNKYLDIIRLNTQRMTQLVSQLLDFQEVDNNQQLIDIPLSGKIGPISHNLVINGHDELINYPDATLLIVEDNEEIRFLMLEQLAVHFRVMTAVNGQDALDILRNNVIDLVITGIAMPIMDGFELCRQMKSHRDFCHIPVIFLIAKNDFESKITCLQVGAEACIEKPFSLQYVKALIVSLLNNRILDRATFAQRPYTANHTKTTQADKEFIDRIMAIIEKNIDNESFGVALMSELMNMSRSSLLRKFKSLFNLSPVRFLQIYRLKKAATFIQEGKYRIGDISGMVGFNSTSHFTRVFSEQFGMSPKEYELQQKEQKRKIEDI